MGEELANELIAKVCVHWSCVSICSLSYLFYLV